MVGDVLTWFTVGLFVAFLGLAIGMTYATQAETRVPSTIAPGDDTVPITGTSAPQTPAAPATPDAPDAPDAPTDDASDADAAADAPPTTQPAPTDAAAPDGGTSGGGGDS